MNQKKAVFFDWDGTLSFDGNHVSNENERAVKQMHAQGHLAFLCTGRSYAFIPDDALHFGFDGIICGAGSHIIIGDETVFRRIIPEEAVEEIILHFLTQEQTCVLEGEKDMFLINEGKSLHTKWPHIKKPEDYKKFVKGCPITKLTLYGKANIQTEVLLCNYFSLITHDRYQEAVLLGCTKATGIEKVLSYFGIDQKDSIGLGDSPNDIDMLKHTALSIVMGNAPDEVKQIADQITGSAEEHGVAQAINQWILT